MATQADWRQAHEGGDDMNATTRNLFPTNDRDDPAHHGFDSSSPFDILMSPGFLTSVGLAALATSIGIAIGVWFGGRREAKKHQSALTSYDMGDMAKLVPLAARVLSNPVVRLYATRMLVRQLRKYVDS